MHSNINFVQVICYNNYFKERVISKRHSFQFSIVEDKKGLPILLDKPEHPF